MAIGGDRAGRLVRRLDLRVGHIRDWVNVDFLRLKILVDGQELLADAGRHGAYGGSWPPAVLGSDSPLIPADPPVRVSLYFEGSMDPDEGNITAIIRADGQHVIWADFRECPADTAVDPDQIIFELNPARSTALGMPDLVFDREQYVAEVRRAIADREWESDPWRTALLLDEYLGAAIRARPDPTDADFYPYYAEPADGDETRFLVTLWNSEFPEHGVVVALTAGPGTPEQRARSMTDTFMATPSEQWPVVERMVETRSR